MGLLLAAGLLCGCPQETGKSGASNPTPPAAGGGDTGKTPPADPGKTETPKETPKAAVAEENIWKTSGVGSVAEYKMVTDMTKPVAMKTEMTQSQTLKDKNDTDYTLTTVMTMNGTAMPANDMKLKWAVAGTATDATAPKMEELPNEKLSAGGTDFDCKHYRTVSEAAGVKSTTDSWMSKGLIVKSVTKNDNMTSTMELTKWTAK
jgi:hypothetical protein